MIDTPFTYLSHLVVLPVRVGDVEARCVVDTGIGPTILTEAVAGRVGCVPNGETFTGQRMSGQEVGVPLAEAPSIAVGSYIRDGHVVGVLDTAGFRLTQVIPTPTPASVIEARPVENTAGG